MKMAASKVGVITDEEKKVLLDRYLDIVWIDDVSEVECVRCHRVPIHHYVSNCQHLFCRNCRTVFSDGGRWRCPSCRQYVTDLSDQKWQLEEQIYQFKVHCPNKKYGCHYEGQLSTIPGHLRKCEDTREAALPVEIKGTTLDTVVDQMRRISDAMGEMRKEVRELKDKYESHLNQLNERVDKLSTDHTEQKERLAKVEPLSKDVKELRDECETKWKQMLNSDYEFNKDLKLIRWDIHEHREQLASFKPLLKDVKQLQDKDSKDALEMLQLKSQLAQQQTLIKVQIQQLNEQKQQSANVEQTLKGVVERDSRGALEIQQLKSHLQQQKTSIEAMTQGQKRQSADALEMQQLKNQLQQPQTQIKVLTQQLNEQNGQLANVEKTLKGVKDKESKVALEMLQLKSQLQQQKTLIETLTHGLNEQKRQSSNVEQTLKEKEVKGAMEIQQLKSKMELKFSQFEKTMKQSKSDEAQIKSIMDGQDKSEKTPQMANAYEVSVHGKRMMMGQTQIPHDQLKAMTHVYTWDIKGIKKINEEFYDIRNSEQFQLIGYHYGALIRLWIQKGQVYLYIQLIDYNKTKLPIDTKSMPRFTFIIKDLSNTPHNRDHIRPLIFEFKEPLEYEKDFINWSSWDSVTLTGPPYLMSNGMKVDVYIEPPSMARSIFSNDGILLWRLDSYKKRLQMEVDGLTEFEESPYFYTSPQGYRVLIRLRLREESVRFALCFVKGEFDSSLTYQFPHRLTLTIFHQDRYKNRVVNDERKVADAAHYRLETVSASLLESDGYVKDDSLLIKAVVESL